MEIQQEPTTSLTDLPIEVLAMVMRSTINPLTTDGVKLANVVSLTCHFFHSLVSDPSTLSLYGLPEAMRGDDAWSILKKYHMVQMKMIVSEQRLFPLQTVGRDLVCKVLKHRLCAQLYWPPHLYGLWYVVGADWIRTRLRMPAPIDIKPLRMDGTTLRQEGVASVAYLVLANDEGEALQLLSSYIWQLPEFREEAVRRAELVGIHLDTLSINGGWLRRIQSEESFREKMLAWQ